jgi:hypothetical protein
MIQSNPVTRPGACKRSLQPCIPPLSPLLHPIARSDALCKRGTGTCSSSGCSSSTTGSSSSSEACHEGHVGIPAHDVSIDDRSGSCQQLPGQPSLQHLHASRSSSSTATAVSRRSLASITGAALLWSSSGLPAWALKTVCNTCTALRITCPRTHPAPGSTQLPASLAVGYDESHQSHASRQVETCCCHLRDQPHCMSVCCCRSS